MKHIIKTEIDVKGSKIQIIKIRDTEYISLTDLARYADSEEPRLPIRDWMRNKDVISYLGLWESIHNDNFKGGEFATFKNNAGSNRFKMSTQKWIKETNAIGIISNSGRYYGGTFAHPDIAFEFASWLSPEFKLYVIQEFQRLKKNEQKQEKIEWHATRLLSKLNYAIHTDAIQKYIVPTLKEEQIKFVYKEEADVLNVALFGMTAKQWRDKNPKLAETGNIRDYADILHLIILNNIENINAELIKMNINQSDRLIQLNNIVRDQIRTLMYNNNLEQLELLQYKNKNNYLIEK